MKRNFDFFMEQEINYKIPCPGDLVYKAALDGAVIEMKVLSIERDSTYLKVKDAYRKNVFLLPVTQLGKTLFVSKEDADKLGAERRMRLFGGN